MAWLDFQRYLFAACDLLRLLNNYFWWNDWKMEKKIVISDIVTD